MDGSAGKRELLKIRGIEGEVLLPVLVVDTTPDPTTALGLTDLPQPEAGGGAVQQAEQGKMVVFGGLRPAT